MGRGRLWAVVAGAVVLVAAAALVVLVVHKQQAIGRQRSQCDEVTALARRLPPAPARPAVAVLGDSYAEGLTLPDPAEAWPFQAFPGGVAVNAVGGTGFHNEGPCGAQAFAARTGAVVAFGAPVVVLQGGLNDVAAALAEETDEAAVVVRRFPGSKVYVVGPPFAPAVKEADVRRIDGALAAAAARTGATYVSALDWPLTYGPDRLHPDAAGARVFAQRVAVAVSPRA